MIMHRCLYPNCGALLLKSGYCKKHERYRPKPKPFDGAKRANEDLYHTAEWRKIRERVISEAQGQCESCGKRSCQLEIHHVIAPRGNTLLFFSETNLMPVCPECHKRITQGEIIERRKANGR